MSKPKMTAKIVKNSSLIAVEQLNVAGMSSHGGSYKKGLNREILSAADEYVSSDAQIQSGYAGIEWIEIATRAVKPSQTCHRCGRQAKKKLCERKHSCVCGANCSRDQNAAACIEATGDQVHQGTKSILVYKININLFRYVFKFFNKA